jgi:hypothetical protein
MMATNISGDSEQAVAFALLEMVMLAETKQADARLSEGMESADREYILDTYAECLHVAKDPFVRR